MNHTEFKNSKFARPSIRKSMPMVILTLALLVTVTIMAARLI